MNCRFIRPIRDSQHWHLSVGSVKAPYKPYYIAWSGFASKERGWFNIEGSIESPSIGK